MNGGDEPVLLFAGSASPQLAAKVAAQLGVTPARGETLRFSDGNLFVRVQENVRGRRVYLLQSIAFPPNEHFVELLFWIDAFKRASAASVTAVVPYFSYAKGDKKDEPRVSIRARVCADAMQAAGVDRLVFLDLHAPQIQGFFTRPVDDLYGMHALCAAASRDGLSDAVVVAPDAGFAKKARRYAACLAAPMALADKERPAHNERAEVVELIGDVRGRTALIVDDFTISGGTLAEVARVLADRGARRVLAMVTHGVFGEGSQQRIDDSPIERLFVTDSVETQPVPMSAKVEVVSVAPLLADAIRRIHHNQSISVLFKT